MKADRVTDDGAKGGTLAAHGLFRRLVMGVGSNVLSQILAASQAILLVPLFLRTWGPDTYGVWISLSALISCLTLVDLGGANYVGNLLAIDFARGDKAAFRKKLSEGVSAFIVIALVALLLTSLYLFGGLSLDRSASGPDVTVRDKRTILFLLSLSFLITIPGGVYATVYRATGQYARGAMAANGFRALEIALGIAVLLLAGSPVIYASVILTNTILRTVCIAWDIHHQVRGFIGGGISLSPRLAWQGRVHLKGSVLFWLMALSTALNLQVVVLVLAAASGSVAVALYSTHRTASGLVGYVGMAVQVPLWVEFSHLWGSNRQVEMRRIALLALRVIPLLSGLASAILWFALPLIYPLWTGRQLNLRPNLLALFLLQALLSAAWSTSSWSLLAANRQRLPALWAAANACVTVALAYWWAPRYGVYGVALATLLGDVFCGLLVYPRLANRFLGLAAGTAEWTIVKTMAILAPLFAGTWFLSRHADQMWAVLAFISLIVLWVVPASYLVMGTEELDRLRTKLGWSRGARGGEADATILQTAIVGDAEG